MASIAVPRQYALVVASLTGAPVILSYQMLLVVWKPKCLDTTTMLTSTLQSTPVVVVSTIASSASFPQYAAVVCTGWVLSRLIFTFTYSSVTGGGAWPRRLSNIFLAASVGGAVVSSFQLVMAGSD